MRRYLLIALLLLAGALAVQTGRLWRSKDEAKRLDANQTALMSDLEHYRTRSGQEAASAQVLRLRVGEFERLRAADAAKIRELGVKLRRVEATARTATETVVALRAALRDTVVVRPPEVGRPIVADTLRVFRWRDAWVCIEGLIDRDSVACRVESVDTLRQVVHRIPRRFLFFRWGTKAIRQEVTSSNPHTKIVYAEYLKLEK